MGSATTAFFSGQYEGIWLVLEALYEWENNQFEAPYEPKMSREYAKEKLIQLGLTDFTDGILVEARDLAIEKHLLTN